MRLKKGVRVRVLGVNPDVDIVGTIAVNKPHLSYPFMVDVDVEASKGLDEDSKKHFEDHYAGPYDKEELEVI